LLRISTLLIIIRDETENHHEEEKNVREKYFCKLSIPKAKLNDA
jgi:hypothetical protein